VDTGRVAIYFGHGVGKVSQHFLRDRRSRVVIEVKVLHFLPVYQRTGLGGRRSTFREPESDFIASPVPALFRR